MKDFLGQPLAIGDDVVFIQPGYRSLMRGRIYAKTPTSWRVEYSGRGFPETLLQTGKQLVKIPPAPKFETVQDEVYAQAQPGYNQ